MSTQFGSPDDELRPIAHSRFISSGAALNFGNFHAGGLPAVVADVRSVGVYANSGGNPLTITGKFDVYDGGVVVATTENVTTSPGDGTMAFLRVGGHVLTQLVIDDGGAGSSGPWVLTASNLDPLPPSAIPPPAPFKATFAAIYATAKALAATPGNTIQLPVNTADPRSDLSIFVINLALSRISTAADGMYIAQAGIFWNPVPGGLPNFSRVHMEGFQSGAGGNNYEAAGPDNANHFVGPFGLQAVMGSKWQKAGALAAQLQYGYDGSNSPNIFGAELFVARVAPT